MSNDIQSRIVPTLAQSIFGLILGSKVNDEIMLDYDSMIDLTKISTPCYFEKTIANQRAPQFPYNIATSDNIANGKLLSESKIAFATADEYELEKILQQNNYKYIYDPTDKRYTYIMTKDNLPGSQIITSVNKMPPITGKQKLCFFTVKQNIDNDDTFSSESLGSQNANIEILYGVEFVSNMSKIDADKPNFVFYTFLFQEAINYADIKNKSKKLQLLNYELVREESSYLKLINRTRFNEIEETLYISEYNDIYTMNDSITIAGEVRENQGNAVSQESVNNEITNSVEVTNENLATETMPTEEQPSEENPSPEQPVSNEPPVTTSTIEQPKQATTSSPKAVALPSSEVTWPWGDMTSIGESVYSSIKKDEKLIPKIILNSLSSNKVYCNVAGVTNIAIEGYVKPYQNKTIIGIYADVYKDGENYHCDCPHIAYKELSGSSMFNFNITHDDLDDAGLLNESKLFVNLYAIDSDKYVNNVIISIISTTDKGFIDIIDVETLDYGKYNFTAKYIATNAISSAFLLIDNKRSNIIPTINLIDGSSYEIKASKINLSKYESNYFNISFEVIEQGSNVYFSNSKKVYLISDSAPIINPDNNMSTIITSDKFDIYFKYENYFTNGFNSLKLSLGNKSITLKPTDLNYADNIYCIPDVYDLLKTSPISGDNIFNITLYTNYDTSYNMTYTVRFVDAASIVLNNANMTITNIAIGSIKIEIELILPEELLDNYIVSAIIYANGTTYDIMYQFPVPMTVTNSLPFTATGELTIDTSKWPDDVYDFTVKILDRYGLTYTEG